MNDTNRLLGKAAASLTLCGTLVLAMPALAQQGGAAAGGADAGAAQTAQDTAAAGALQEVVVTAERRAANIQTTPIAISAVSGDQLASQQLTTVTDLQKTIPNMQVLDAGTYQSINIRGIGNTAITPSIVPGVAVTHDGLLSDETIFIGEPFYDIADVEVLRGPQGTLVGASSTGGAVEITSQNPNFRGINGFGEFEFGNYTDKKFDGAINLPITDTLAARLAFNEELRNSFYHNYNWLPGPAHGPGDPGSIHNQNARLGFLWQPTDSFQAVLKGSLNYANYTGIGAEPNQYTFHSGPGQACPDGSPGPVCHSLFYNYSTHIPFVTNYNLPLSGNSAIVDRYSLDMRWTMAGGIVLRSLTGYQHLDGGDTLQDDDFSSANFQIHTKDVGPNDNYYSEDISLQSPSTGKITWILGADWFYRDTDVEDWTWTALGALTPFNPLNPAVNPSLGIVPSGSGGTRVQGLSVDAVQRTEGLYGNVDWNITNTLQLQVGARGNWDQNYSKGGQPGWFPGAPNGTGIVFGYPTAAAGRTACVNPSFAGEYCQYLSNVAQQTDDVPTGKIDLNWTPVPGQFFYAFWARGYKSGGVIVGTKNGFRPEIVNDYELGWKSQLLNNHLQTSIGGYWMRYQNMQLPTLDPSTGRNAVTNIPASSTIRGIEATLNGQFGGFGTNLSLTIDNSKIGNVTEVETFRLPASAGGQVQCAPGQVSGCFNYSPYIASLGGEQNPYTPKFTASATVDYRFVFGNGSSVVPSVTYSYTGPQFDSIFQVDNYYLLTARHLLNASLTYNSGPWQAELFCNNCNNEIYVQGAGGVSSGDVWYYGNPMTLGLRVNRSF